LSRGWLVVFAKRPQSGSVKTRLCPPFTPAEAADFYRCLLADVLDESARAARALELEPILAVDPPEACAALAATAPPGFRIVAQRGADLGARMNCAAREAAAAGAPLVLLRGSDSPALSQSTLREAKLALADADVAISPDRDGGYGLVALGPRALLAAVRGPRLFDHPMSTPSVLQETLARAAQLGLRGRTITPGFDIDRVEDLRWLAEARHADPALPCPRTLGFLEASNRLPPGSPRSTPVPVRQPSALPAEDSARPGPGTARSGACTAAPRDS
jgi:rSAM/selenodomain-associated transferase 1